MNSGLGCTQLEQICLLEARQAIWSQDIRQELLSLEIGIIS